MTAPEDGPRDDMTEEEFWRGMDDADDVGDSRPKTVMPFPVIPDDDADDIDPDEIPSL